MDDLEKLLIERACERLVAEYCHLIDHGHASKVADQFTDDGVWRSAEVTMSGRAELVRGFAARERKTGSISRHVCNALIDVVDENNATGVAYLTLYRHDGEPGRTIAPVGAPLMVGEYRDQFVRTADGWRFKRRDAVVSFAKSKE